MVPVAITWFWCVTITVQLFQSDLPGDISDYRGIPREFTGEVGEHGQRFERHVEMDAPTTLGRGSVDALSLQQVHCDISSDLVETSFITEILQLSG